MSDFKFEVGQNFTILVGGKQTKARIIDRQSIFENRYKMYELRTDPPAGERSVRRIFSEFQLRALRESVQSNT